MPIKRIYLPSLLVAVIFLAGAGGEQPTHLDKAKLPYGCGTCHQGFAFQAGGGADTCLACHRKGQPPTGFVKGGVTPQDVASLFSKSYTHPWRDEEKVHRASEVLPEVERNAKRHATCADCHNTHYSSPGRKFAGVAPSRTAAKQMTEVTPEYEVCYRCHGDSINLPATGKNKKAEFALTNASYHPVEGELGTKQNPLPGEGGKDHMPTVSMLGPYKGKDGQKPLITTISCSSCHGSDSEKDATGIHGSNYRYLLRYRYETSDKSFENHGESYTLCYQCHDRSIILGRDGLSFKFHKLHVTGEGSKWGYSGTSCYSCHNSHGSPEYPYLLRFDRQLVTPNADKSAIVFSQDSPRSHKGSCELTCHGVEHRRESTTGAFRQSSSKSLSSTTAPAVKVVVGVY